MSPLQKSPWHGVLRLALFLALVAGLVWGYRVWSERRLEGADLEQLLEITRTEPRNGLAQYYLGRQLAEQGRLAAATKAYREAAELAPRDLRPQEALVVSLIAQGQTAEAQRLLSSLKGRFPHSPVVWMSGGRLANQARDYAAAVEHFRKVTELAPREREGWYGLGMSLTETHRYEDARAALRKALELEPRQPDTLAALGFCALDSGSPLEAQDWLREALAVNPDHAEANRYLAEALLVQAGNETAQPEAKAAGLRAVRAAPASKAAWYWLGRAYLRGGETANGIAALRQALSLEPRDEGSLQLLGQTLLRHGQEAEGRALLARFQRVGAFKAEMDQLQKRAEQEPRNAELHFRMARLHVGVELWAAAVREYDAGLLLDPGNQAARREREAALQRVERRQRAAP